MADLTNPWALLLLVGLPLVAWLWQRRSRAALAMSRGDEMASLPRGRAPRVQRWRLGLRLLGLALIIVAIAGPRWPDRTRTQTKGIALAIVVDVSASMGDEDFVLNGVKVSRLDGVRNVFHLLVEGGTAPNGDVFHGRPQDLIMLVTFATRPETACPLTLDHAALLKILDAQRPRGSELDGTTNPGDALAWAVASLKTAPTPRQAIIFLTDGDSNVPPPALKPRQAAQLAAKLDIPIYLIDASSDAEGIADARKIMQDVASMTKGEYFRAGDGSALTRAVQTIDALEKGKITPPIQQRYHLGYVWFALAGFVCWALVVLLETTRWRILF